ncbi:nitrogen fixation protein NifU [Legionella lansingensis]|uniref:Nitrogen fixation protein NifU n=1 Tax=Legionella lansingensis TaxID=45067 RepID=A0A0W0VUP3_9GAMM|nr:SUF system NifU family Fe-S cluster assembly protein [Legionella lansingensis]KTD23625.1 nitrogen fixation protein NifU [Legionella lansingensis]SNV52448.1 nitrogen fixation protein NifU [Legionella lansingensis]
MIMELRELYQEIIIDHNRNPRNHHVMSDATAQAQGFNPLCGDKLTLFLKLDGDVVKDVSFVGSGCAISQASASLMTETLIGKTINEAHELFERFHTMVTSGEEQVVSLDKLAVLAGVKAYPARVKCATLAWHTLEAALNKSRAVVSTE